MSARPWLWWLLGGSVIAYVLYNRQAVTNVAESGVETVTAALTGWKSVNDGPTWVPVINQTEDTLGIPTDLLARVAYQESRFRPDVITGATVSPAGALGILQMMPQYFDTVQRPRPFSTQDTLDQINQAGSLLVSLYNHFQDWALALAAYNDGQTNIDHYLAGTHTLPTETNNYVSQILSDVPVSAGLPG